jgi:hypothetical protein
MVYASVGMRPGAIERNSTLIRQRKAGVGSNDQMSVQRCLTKLLQRAKALGGEPDVRPIYVDISEVPGGRDGYSGLTTPFQILIHFTAPLRDDSQNAGI